MTFATDRGDKSIIYTHLLCPASPTPHAQVAHGLTYGRALWNNEVLPVMS